ncbi:MAG: molybdopterin-dependent oxidoreductase, partial [Gammaproteobacteria bacterium]
DRLRQPLVRENGELREASWAEAFARVEAGLAPWLRTHGRAAIGVYVGNPNVHNLAGSLFLRPLLKALATRNLFTASTVDQIPKHVASGLMFGDPGALPVPDIERTDCLLLLGANPWESNGSLWTAPDLPGRIRRLRRRGGRFVVVDPRRTRTAEHADLHLAIRPGHDAHWLLALAQVIVSEGRAAPGRLGDFSDGLDTLAPRLAAFTPEAVAAHCDIDAATTRRIARELAAAPRAAVYARIGTHASRHGTLAAWATELLNVLTGNLDREGGVMFPLAPHDRLHDGTPGGRGFTTGRWHSRVSAHPEVMGELPVACLAEEIETPGSDRIRALVTVAGNPVLSTPDGARLDRALAGLDFMVSVDIYLNETTRHADVILPPPSALERAHYDILFLRFAVRSVANYSPPVFASDAPTEQDILLRLALIAGGAGADGDVAAAAETYLAEQVAREVANPASPIAGAAVADILARVDGVDACDRMLDFLVRTGPFGDGFADDVDGLNLARLRA